MNFQTRISGHQRVKGAEHVALATNVDTKQLTPMKNEKRNSKKNFLGTIRLFQK